MRDRTHSRSAAEQIRDCDLTKERRPRPSRESRVASPLLIFS